jgi:hypothetical protein
MSKRDQDRELSRRALIKWSLAASAALGVSRGRLLDIIERTAGKSTAQAASATPNKRSVHIRAGTGGLAWFQLMWPHNDVAAAKNTAFAWPFLGTGQTTTITGTGGMLTTGPQTAFRSNEAGNQMTCLMAGSNEQHTDNANSIAHSLSSGSMFAIASVLQADIPAVVPVITVDNMDFGTAPGAPDPSIVPGADDIVGLFNSAASRAGGLLASSNHADLYRAQYETLAALNRASTLSTTRTAYHTGRSASKFLGTNLSTQLAFQPGIDDVAYGMTGSVYDAISTASGVGGTQRDQITAFGKTLATAAKAFQLGLTSSIVLPGMRDDPHGAFGGGGQLTADSTAVITTLRIMLDAFMTDLSQRKDSVTMQPLSDNIVITIEGDTPKDPCTNATWPDNTPNNSNWMFIYGGGKLKTGWFGSVDRNSAVKGFDPSTGAAKTNDGDLQAKAAVAATAYAITNGDLRRVGDFTNTNINGLIATS